MMKVWKLAVLTTALCSVSGMVMASCKPVEGGDFFKGSTVLQAGNLTVGSHLPVGSVIYRQRIYKSAMTLSAECTPVPSLVLRAAKYMVTPLPQASAATGIYRDKAYETGVPGIAAAVAFGVRFHVVIPYLSDGGTVCTNGCTVNDLEVLQSAELVLIKTGNTAAGTIQGADLPTIGLGLGTSLTDISPLLEFGFTGSINIVSRTCETPDINVDMGTRKVSEFSGVNTGTPWKDFEIQLNNCPAFYGRFPTSGPQMGSDGSVISTGTRIANAIGYRLDPNQTPIDASKGVMKLDAAAEGSTAAASGVGLQIADQNEAPVALATLKASGIVPTANDGANYTIPLKARYLQTESKVTGGPANATAVFTINYQ